LRALASPGLGDPGRLPPGFSKERHLLLYFGPARPQLTPNAAHSPFSPKRRIPPAAGRDPRHPLRPEAYPDPTDETRIFVAVDVKSVAALPKPVTLADIKASARLGDMLLVRQSRLSTLGARSKTNPRPSQPAQASLAPSLRLGSSVRDCAISLNFSTSESPSDNSIARRHAAIPSILRLSAPRRIYRSLKRQMNPPHMTTFMESIV